MPRYEIVAHVTSEIDCLNAEEAAAIIRSQIQEGPAGPNQLLHLAVWREEPGDTPSPVDAAIRDKLVDFFLTLEQRAAEAEETFRGQVEAILLGSFVQAKDTTVGSASRAERTKQRNEDEHKPE
jgi:hypothetical protein